jgi:hypothetical protein
MRDFIYFAKAQYPGKAALWFGNVAATNDEHARMEFQKEWSRVSPHPMPKIVEVHRGQLIIKLDESDRPEPA